jgi:hypothetical protein
MDKKLHENWRSNSWLDHLMSREGCWSLRRRPGSTQDCQADDDDYDDDNAAADDDVTGGYWWVGRACCLRWRWRQAQNWVIWFNWCVLIIRFTRLEYMKGLGMMTVCDPCSCSSSPMLGMKQVATLQLPVLDMMTYWCEKNKTETFMNLWSSSGSSQCTLNAVRCCWLYSVLCCLLFYVQLSFYNYWCWRYGIWMRTVVC